MDTQHNLIPTTAADLVNPGTLSQVTCDGQEAKRETINGVVFDTFPTGEVIRYAVKDKVAILGTAGTLSMAPFGDKEFEIWGVAVVTTYPICKRTDLLFELHDRAYWGDPNVTARMLRYSGNTYMQDHYPEIPNSLKFPKELLTQIYRPYHMTTITYMLALAYHSFLMTGRPKHVALFGVHMEAGEEYGEQRPCCEYWLGRMEGAGMDIYMAPGGAVLTAPGLYAYQNYNPVIVEMRKRIDGLMEGARHFEQERNNAEGHRWKQMGAADECEYWMKKFQRGEIKGG